MKHKKQYLFIKLCLFELVESIFLYYIKIVFLYKIQMLLILIDMYLYNIQDHCINCAICSFIRLSRIQYKIEIYNSNLVFIQIIYNL